jgi:hypothetical protein
MEQEIISTGSTARKRKGIEIFLIMGSLNEKA